MNEEVVTVAARSAVMAAQDEVGAGDEMGGMLRLLSAVTLAYGYVRGALEAAGISDEQLDAAEDVGSQLARRMDRIRRSRIAEGMAQA